jgi:hypothetical protein
VLASDFQRTLAFSPQAIPSFLPKAGAKVQLFPLRAMLFFIFFSSFPQQPVSQEEKFNRTTNLS